MPIEAKPVSVEQVYGAMQELKNKQTKMSYKARQRAAERLKEMMTNGGSETSSKSS